MQLIVKDLLTLAGLLGVSICGLLMIVLFWVRNMHWK